MWFPAFTVDIFIFITDDCHFSKICIHRKSTSNCPPPREGSRVIPRWTRKIKNIVWFERWEVFCHGAWKTVLINFRIFFFLFTIHSRLESSAGESRGWKTVRTSMQLEHHCCWPPWINRHLLSTWEQSGQSLRLCMSKCSLTSDIHYMTVPRVRARLLCNHVIN